jgi:hypothetical protein
MAYQTRPTFPHRFSRDGTVSSICSACLVTIASAGDARELARHEHAHVCDPVRLYQLGADPSRRFLVSGNRLAS